MSHDQEWRRVTRPGFIGLLASQRNFWAPGDENARLGVTPREGACLMGIWADAFTALARPFGYRRILRRWSSLPADFSAVYASSYFLMILTMGEDSVTAIDGHFSRHRHRQRALPSFAVAREEGEEARAELLTAMIGHCRAIRAIARFWRLRRPRISHVCARGYASADGRRRR